MEKFFDFNQVEKKIYQKWEKGGFFNPDSLKISPEASSFCIVLPPPNVTGTLHIGHAEVLAVEDVLVRFQRMQGKRVLWIPGTDHAAIATQAKVEKVLKNEGKTKYSLGKKEFLKRVKKFAQDSHDTIINQCKRMGASLDWSREAYTLDKTRSRVVYLVFKMMYEDGLIYRGEKIVNWCPHCFSTLSDDEVEYREQESFLYSFSYAKDFPLVISTTRPETKLGDVAVAVNPQDKRYKKLVGKKFKVNFVGIPLEIEIIADKRVDKNFGTGAVGVTPAHSIIDWEIAQEHHLKIIKVIDEKGFIRKGFGQFSGKKTKEAAEMILEKLEKQGLLKEKKVIKNNISVCYRCDTPIEPIPSQQWFINVDKKIKKLGNKSLKQLCLEAVEKGVFGRKKIRIIPKRFEKNYFQWMRNLRDWCISRQIWFGHSIPVWYRKKNKDKEEVIVSEKKPEEKGWKKDQDTLDTWFSSGMWTFSTMARKPEEIKIRKGKLIINTRDFKYFHPTSVLETAYDILFFWVARMIMMTTYAIQDIPFFDVYLQGLVVDKDGKKMSKSRGNVIDPLKMIEKYGTDATRLSLIIGTSAGNNMSLSEEKFIGFRNLVNKIWNIYRFAFLNYKLTKEVKLEPKFFSDAEAWIIATMNKLIKEVTWDLENYQLSSAGEKLREFTWSYLADWYLETTKFQKNTQTEKVFSYLLVNLLKLWHPFIPFLTEHLWQQLNLGGNLIVENWPQEIDCKIDQNQVKSFELTREIISIIRNLRAENKIPNEQKLKGVIILEKKWMKLIENNLILVVKMRTGLEEILFEMPKNKPEKIYSEKIKTTITKGKIYLF